MTPYDHALSSAKSFGGEWEDYIAIHSWFDETKAFTGTWTHRALRHHSAGVEWAIEKFGHRIKTSSGRYISVRLIAEKHIEEDCGFIPTPDKWLSVIGDNAAPWMKKVAVTSRKKLTIEEENENEH
jgi:hypothetical protein